MAGTSFKNCGSLGKRSGADSGGYGELMRKLASALGISERTMRRIAGEDLR